MDNELRKIIIEELTKSEIRGIAASEIDSVINSKEFKNKVKEISAKVLEELYKILWTRKNFWSDAIRK